MDPILAIALPGGALALGMFGFIVNKISSWNFDRKHPALSRKGLRDAAARDRAVTVVEVAGGVPVDAADGSDVDLEVALALRQADEQETEERAAEVPAFLRRGAAPDTYELNKMYLEKLLRRQVRTIVREDAAAKSGHMRTVKLYPPKISHPAPEQQNDEQRDAVRS